MSSRLQQPETLLQKRGSVIQKVNELKAEYRKRQSQMVLEAPSSPEPVEEEAAFPKTQQGWRSPPPKVNQGALDRQKRDFRRYQRKRLDSLMRTYKKKMRKEDQDYFAGQEELDALFKEGQARSMFGVLPRDPQGALLPLPTSDGLRDYLLKQKKTRY